MTEMKKIGEILNDFPEWQELFRFAAELINTGKQTNEGLAFFAGRRLAELLSKLSGREILIEGEIKT